VHLSGDPRRVVRPAPVCKTRDVPRRCRRTAPLLAALLLAAPTLAHAVGDASVEGTVTLPSLPQPPAATSRYPAGTSYTPGPPDPPVAVVYLEGAFPGTPPGPPTTPAVMAQRKYQFAPGVLPVQRGTVVEFPNLDDEYHSVFSYSKPRRFDLGRYRKDESPAKLTFDQPGVVKLFCEIHEHMRGTILVLDTPYFARTDAEGRYRLEALPPGTWTIRAWIDEKTMWSVPVTLDTGKTAHVDFPPAGPTPPAP
jgi:plastocyanin